MFCRLAQQDTPIPTPPPSQPHLLPCGRLQTVSVTFKAPLSLRGRVVKLKGLQVQHLKLHQEGVLSL